MKINAPAPPHPSSSPANGGVWGSISRVCGLQGHAHSVSARFGLYLVGHSPSGARRSEGMNT